MDITSKKPPQIVAEMANEASEIMADPASAAGEGSGLIKAPVGTPENALRILNALPGLIGAIDQAIRVETGVKEGFVFALLVFANNSCIHAGNAADQSTMLKAIIEFADSVRGQVETMQ